MWRGLSLFWGGFVLLLGGAIASLQWLGPPGAATGPVSEIPAHGEPAAVAPVTVAEPPGAAAAHAPAAAQKLAAREPPAQVPAAHPPVAHESAAQDAANPPVAVLAAGQPGRLTPGEIAAPDAALLEPAKGPADGALPRIAADGRMAGRVYAGGFKPVAGRPRIAIIVAGFGLSAATDEDSVRSLPAAISFAVSPYAPQPLAALQAARRAGHELLLSIPMEPQGFPLNDPGGQALLSTAAPEENSAHLRWALGRFAGYAGATAALGPGLNGERFAQLGEQMEAMLSELAARGLFYLDPRVASTETQALPFVWSRAANRLIDDAPGRAGIDARLAELETIAADQGGAVGLAGVATPVVLDRLKAWARGLAERGYDLAPASAMMVAPSQAAPAALLQAGKVMPAAHP